MEKQDGRIRGKKSMKHFHGTPISGKRVKVADFIENRFVLIPWKYPSHLYEAMEFSKGFIVDNSAFSFWSSGEKPDWSKYVTWVSEFYRHPRFEFAIIPDVIDGDVDQNNYLIDFWQRVAKRIPACPVWHLDEEISRLQWLCMNWERVAIGSSGKWSNPGQSEGWWNRMDEAFNSICVNGYPLAKIHGLRMLRKEIVERYPFCSCDSTNAAQNGTREAKKNGVDTSWGSQTVARRIEQTQSPSRFEKNETQSLMHILNDNQ